MNGHEHANMQDHSGGGNGDHHHIPEDSKTADGGESTTHHQTMSGMNHDTKDHYPHAPAPKETSAQHHDMSHMNHGAMHNMHMPSPDQPIFPTVTIAVCHCGAGCLLGDIVGEWLIYGANIMINCRSIWPEFLIGSYPHTLSLSPFSDSKQITHSPSYSASSSNTSRSPQCQAIMAQKLYGVLRKRTSCH
jgi:hypothetical protein